MITFSLGMLLRDNIIGMYNRIRPRLTDKEKEKINANSILVWGTVTNTLLVKVQSEHMRNLVRKSTEQWVNSIATKIDPQTDLIYAIQHMIVDVKENSAEDISVGIPYQLRLIYSREILSWIIGLAIATSP